MKQSKYKLSKGCIKDVVDNSIKKPVKPYLVQAYQIQAKDTPEKPRKVMWISDGEWHIKAISTGTQDLHNFDVIAMLDYRARSMKDMSFVVLDKASIVFSGLKSIIGNPVELSKSRATLADIEPIIPEDAKLLDPSMVSDTESLKMEEDEDSQMLAAVLAPIPVPQIFNAIGSCTRTKTKASC